MGDLTKSKASSSSLAQMTQNQNSSGQTTPWGPTQGPLQTLINNIANVNPTQTGWQGAALTKLYNTAASLPNSGPQISGVANNLINGGQDYSGILTNALSNMQGQLNPVATASLDPTQTPGIANVLDTIRNDVSNSVNGMFAGAGRDLSGLNQQALARGIAQGEAVPLLNQYNQNVSNRLSASNSLATGANSTASGLNALQQSRFGNMQAGANLAGNLPSFYAAPAQLQLNAANAAYNQPVQNISGLAGLLGPIARLGSQYNNSAETTGTTNQSAEQTKQGSILDAALGIGKLLFG